jgi:glycosyltransferase involved in cell wall biosynthesis
MDLTVPRPIPRLTMITAALNPGPEVRDTLSSILSQAYPNLQVIFVDGGSRPECFAHVEPFLPEVDFLIREPDRGISDAWNKALARADGDIVGILNADDHLLPGALHKVVAGFAAHPGVEIVHGNAQRIDGTRHSVRRPWPWPRWTVRIGTPVVHPATFVARSLYRRIGGFDLRWRVAMDYDFMLRALRAGARLHHIDDELVVFRGGGLSDREPLRGFREVRECQLEQGLGRAGVELLHQAKMLVRGVVRPRLDRWRRGSGAA